MAADPKPWGDDVLGSRWQTFRDSLGIWKGGMLQKTTVWRDPATHASIKQWKWLNYIIAQIDSGALHGAQLPQ